MLERDREPSRVCYNASASNVRQRIVTINNYFTQLQVSLRRS
jgi:hypothetical protein